MITRSMKRIVLGILESSREVADTWKAVQNRKSLQRRQDFVQAMNRLQRAINRLDRMNNA
jgi:hypothetical protein